MARQKKGKKSTAHNYDKFPHLPTLERLKHPNVLIRNNIGQVEDPLRIDKLLKNGIIDEMQHLYGMQITTLWTIAQRPFIRAMNYELRSGARPIDANFINLSRMTGEDQFYKTMSLLRPRERGLIHKICFEELPAIAAGRSLGLPVNSITSYVRAAFDALGEALKQMREQKKALEEPAESTYHEQLVVN